MTVHDLFTAHVPVAMNAYRHLLRSERGSALIDSMVGVIVTALVVSSTASLAVGITASLRASNAFAVRSSALQSLVNDRSSLPDAVTLTGVTASVSLSGTPTPVTVWKTVPTPGTAVIHAATNRDRKALTDLCTNPASIPAASCVSASVTVNLLDAPAPVGLMLSPTWAAPGVAGGTPTTVTAGQIGSFNATGKTQVRFTVKIGSASGPGTITFMNGTTILATVPYDGLTYGAVPGYQYGAVTVTGATTVTVNVTGGSAALSRFTVYEVPR